VATGSGAPATPDAAGEAARDQAAAGQAAEAPAATAPPATETAGPPPATGTGTAGAESAPAPGEFHIQVESFIDGDQRTLAITRDFWERRTGSAVEILEADVEGDTWHRVLIGSYATRQDAAAALEAFQDAGTVRDDAMIVHP
jgi:septal ring-binding cell division protein DamX